MVIDPSKISLKGFFLAPQIMAVGGARNIFSNGVMCAKIYLGFSYSAPEDDTCTVRDVANWLLNNGDLRSVSSDETDTGSLASFGWTSFGNTDPNNGEYLFDNAVIVPENTEDYDKVPGNSRWHLEYYVRAPHGESTPINVYYCAHEPIKFPGLSTSHDNLMSISPEACPVFSGMDFIINDTEINPMDGGEAGKEGRVLRELNYNDNYDHNLYGIRSFSHVYPSTDTSDLEHVPYDITPSDAGFPAKNIFAVYSQFQTEDSNRIIYILNKFNSGFEIDLLSSDYNYSSVGYWRYEGQSDNQIYIADGLNGFEHDFNTMNGLPLGTQSYSHIELQASSVYSGFSPCIDNYGCNKEQSVFIYVNDNFGSRICIEVDINDGDNGMFDWSIKSACLVE